MQNFFEKLNQLLASSALDEAEKFLEDTLETALTEHNDGLVLAVLNELVGFYRDTTRYEEALKYAKAILPLINKLNLNNTITHVKSLINIANILRVSDNLEKAIRTSKEALSIYENYNLNDEETKAALYNNLALAYQQKDAFSEAILVLLKALEIIEKTNDEIKIATSYSNLALCYLKTGDYQKAKDLLKKAEPIFTKNPDDFHYTGFLANLGEYYYLTQDFNNAKLTYEKACAYLLKNTGYSLSYYTILANLFEVYDVLKIEHHKPGLQVAKTYYETYFLPEIKKLPLKLQNKISVGLFGYGSECYYLSDLTSEDHDFDPGFIVLVADTINEADFSTIKELYQKMPKIFERYYRFKNPRKGVFYFSSYLDYLVNTSSLKEIKKLNDENLSLLTNGEIWFDPQAKLTSFRQKLLANYDDCFYNRLITKSLEFSQIYQYNLERLAKRNDHLSYNYLLYNLPNTLIELLYIINKTYLPHPKIRLKLAKQLKFNQYFIKAITAIYDKENITSSLDEIVKLILLTLKREGLIKKVTSSFIGDYKSEMLENYSKVVIKNNLIKDIIVAEWDMLQKTKNEGGRANCQDNLAYFTLMRKSQFMAWSQNLLESYLQDLSAAKLNNRNLITEKYIHMEKVRDYKFYQNLSSYLPKLSPERIKIQEEIIKIQLEMLLDFKKSNEVITENMRKIYSKEDSMQEISYETYLRGEISTYSEKTLILYAKELVSYEKNNENIVETIISNSFYLLGNETL